MKLIKQTTLWNNDGNADKVYEIDLCEIAPNRYIVNFRYGRRGGTLKDGTKTAMPVLLQQAEDIFKKLADEKRKGGYKDTDNYVAETQMSIAETKPVETIANDYEVYLLRCLKEATQPIPGKIIEKWPLGRIIWRAGELRISTAAPFIIPQLSKGNALVQYSACWSLGRCGNILAIEPLQQIYQSNASTDFVKRMAIAALLELKKINNSSESLIKYLLNNLPNNVQVCLQNEDAGALKNLLVQASANPASHQQITTVYLLAENFPAAQTAIYEWLKQIKLLPNQFKPARHIFKLAEFREDAQIFSLLAYKFETTPGLFRLNLWNRNSYAYYNGKNFKKAIDELKKEDSGLAYSDTTKNYFMRRTWRAMRTLGQDGAEAYIRFAFGVLLEYNAYTGKKEAEKVEKSFYTYNHAANVYESITETKQYAAYPNSLLLNHILFSNSDNYFLKRNNKAWQLKLPNAENISSKREEAFAELWDKYPQASVQLLFDSELEIVHNFAVKALKDRNDLARYFDLPALKKLLLKPFSATAELVLILAEKMYDFNHPDEELVTMLLLHPISNARAIASQWIGSQLDYFLKQTNIPTHLIINAYDDVFETTNNWLKETTAITFEAEKICYNVINQLIILPKMLLAEAAADNAAKLLSNYFLPFLSSINIESVIQLLNTKITSVQTLSAIILLNHNVQPEQFPEGLLSSTIQSTNPQVRQAGITLFGRLPENQLFENASLVATFCVSPFAEIRLAIQPTVEKLNAKNKFFGQSLLYDLLPYMHRKETFEDLHSSLYQLFTEPLAEHLATIEPVTALSFLHSRFPVPPLLGLFILKNYDKADNLSMRQWVRMANHEILEVRQFCWDLFNQNIERIQNEASEALRILDSIWDDSRSFAFTFFRKNFDENNWLPELLVSVCDSTREDVQSFGREMITKYFKEENGELYLMQLSQHPAQQVQHFATHYLEQFAADKPLNIEKLEAYFIAVLSQVNKAGIAKKRIFSFLKDEAMKNKQVAATAVKIIARQSATMAIADKAACIGIMHDLQRKYPELEMPLSILPISHYQPA